LHDRSLKLSTRITRSHHVPGGYEVRADGQSRLPYADEPDTRHVRPSSRPLAGGGPWRIRLAVPPTGRQPGLLRSAAAGGIAVSGRLGLRTGSVIGVADGYLR
jgi:hypothetical protein